MKPLLRRSRSSVVPQDAANPDIWSSLDAAHRSIIEQAQPFTMTSHERLAGLVDAVEYIVQRAVPGAFVECGVWRGGSVLAAILALQHLGVDDRDIYLFDTFEGMTRPTDADVSRYTGSAKDDWDDASRAGVRAWHEMFGSDTFGLDQVRELVLGSGYPEAHLHFVAGPVEATVPASAPAEIALLRLDTDWYESTRHELEHLYPRLRSGGVLLIDDYGHWDGCRRAVDEYFASAVPLLFSRLDYTGRIAVKH